MHIPHTNTLSHTLTHSHTQAQPGIVIGLARKMNSLFRFEILFSKAAQKSFHSKIKNDEKNTEKKSAKNSYNVERFLECVVCVCVSYPRLLDMNV